MDHLQFLESLSTTNILFFVVLSDKIRKLSPDVRNPFNGSILSIRQTHQVGFDDVTTPFNFRQSLIRNTFKCARRYSTHLKTKYCSLNIIYNSDIYTNEYKNIFLSHFGAIQKCIFGFRRLLTIYRYKKTNIIVSTDLLMTDISQSDKNVLGIIQNKQQYLFTKSDLERIIYTCLTNNDCLFTQLIDIKNPFTGIAFDTSTLYNIYFFIVDRAFYMSKSMMLFHYYFLSNFNLKIMENDYEHVIRENIIDATIAGLSKPQKINLVD